MLSNIIENITHSNIHYRNLTLFGYCFHKFLKIKADKSKIIKKGEGGGKNLIYFKKKNFK